MKNAVKRFAVLCLCLALVAGVFLFAPPEEAMAAHYTDYSTVVVVPNQGDCPSMQGCCTDGTYIYCSKINTETETSAVIARVHKDTGEITWLTNSATGTMYFSQLGHANDLSITTVGGVKTIFVATGAAGTGEYSLVRLALDGTTLTQVGHYTVTYEGAETNLAGAEIVSVSDTEIRIIGKRSKNIYTATIGVNQTGGEVPLELLCKLNLTDVTINGTVKDISGFVAQGFAYYDNKIFVPMTGDSANINTSCIVSYDLDGASGTIKNDPNFSTWIVSSTYANLFEIENCVICPGDGKMYFCTNRRKTREDANHDGIHVLTGYVYDPTLGDTLEPANYRWNVTDDRLVSVTKSGAVYNTTTKQLGSITDGVISGGHYSLDRAVVLKHDEPWVLEWKSSSWSDNSMLLSTYSKSNYAGNYFIHRRKNSSLIAIGEHTGTQYNNYGIRLSDHGIDGSQTHVYRMENRIAADGSNMVYLLVDGAELGAMNNYYIGATAQGTTSDWISGKDFAFSYLGTAQHPLNCSITYLRVWGRGVFSEVDQPNVYRWETQNDTLVDVSGVGLTANAPTVIDGTCTDGVYSGGRLDLDKEIVLLHSRPWTVEWKAEGAGTSRLISASGSSRLDSYILKSTIVGFGSYDGSQFHHYGIKLSDHDIDKSASHVYRMTNRVASDGTNMVYLYVDGVELGPVNNHYIGSTLDSTGVDWVSGKDFTFGYFGTLQHPLTDFSIEYIQVWENGISAEDTPDSYRWEADSSGIKSITTDGFVKNKPTLLAGSCTDGSFTEAYYRLKRSVVLRHDQEWAVQWQSEGDWLGSANGALLLSSSLNTNEENAPFLYRRKNSGIIAFGVRADGKRHHYGINLSDHGIDGTVSHTYLLTNRINSDGSNMIYLSVDGTELGAMNNYYVGATAQNTTSDWVSGKDFMFSYMGTPQYPISNCTMQFMQVDEGAKVCVHSYQSVVTEPTCTADGYTTYTCESCGDSYADSVVEALGHSYSKKVTQAATCTETGIRTYTCSACGHSYAKTIAAKGHSYQSTTTAPTCTMDGKTEYVCSVCNDSYSEEITAFGHSYGSTVTAPTCTAEGYTTYTCGFCGDSYTADTVAAPGHNYSDGNCTVCGAADPDYVAPVVVPTINLVSPTLNFEDEIYYNIYYTASDLTDVVEMGLITFDSYLAEGTIDDALEVVPGYVLIGENYMSHTNGIPAKMLSDALYFRVYAKLSDGTYVYSMTAGYHAVAYAKDILANSTNEKMKALVVAMLNYGAAAQTHFEYKTDALMNSFLTADQQALVSAYSSDMVDSIVSVDKTKVGEFSGVSGGYTALAPNVVFEGAFAINFYFTPAKTMDGELKLYYWTLDDYNVAETLTAENATGVVVTEETSTAGKYVGAVTGIAAKQIDQTVFVCGVYESDGVSYPTGVIAYSLAAYCQDRIANGGATMQEFAKATVVYGNYAKAYFA